MAVIPANPGQNLFDTIGRLYVALEVATKERERFQSLATELQSQLQALKQEVELLRNKANEPVIR